jgi:signal transduction histidine kinase
VGLLDCAPSLEAWVEEVEAGLAFVRRAGNEEASPWLDSFRWLADVLRGESSAAAEAVPADRYAGTPFGLLHAHITRAIAAAIFGDQAGLARHTAAAEPLLPNALGTYVTAVARLLRALALAGQARITDGDERAGLLSELDEVARWLAARAGTAPDNFLHLLRLVEAERAWAVGDFHAAVVAFDAARREAAPRQRPWHRALIAEHAARFYLAHGVEHAGFDLLARARQQYFAWGATAKVSQLDWAYPALRPQPDTIGERGAEHPGDLPQRRATVTTGTVDLLGIVSASQALSSETSIERLHARVVGVLSAMTGATGVNLLLWDEDRQDWLLPASDSAGAVAVGGTGQERAAPMSVLRYVQRTREPLVVADAGGDDRFARDPYFAGLNGCSLLAVPVLSRGALQAVLLLENRLIRGAFTAGRLEAVNLIAGQLAVSLDNAQLYAEVAASRARIVAAADETRRRIERDLHDGVQQRLVTQALLLSGIRDQVAADVRADIDEVRDEMAATRRELRDICQGVHPAILTEVGLGAAIRGLARRSPLPVRVQLRADGRLPASCEVTAYYVAAEAFTNAAKHAAASAVDILIEEADGTLTVQVRDDGAGGADANRGSGLTGLRDRVEAVGGSMTVDSPAGVGTVLTVLLPVTPA